MKKIYLDFDGVIVNTIKAIVNLYNEDFPAYSSYKPVHWADINTWDFKELTAATPEYINHYFNQPRFFNSLEFMPYALKCIRLLLLEGYDITIVSSGFSPNLRLKETWTYKNIPCVKFVGVNLKHYKDKSHIDMSDGIFIDDNSNNLETSNATTKICFGDVYDWNEEWKGIRIYNWSDLYSFIEKGEKE